MKKTSVAELLKVKNTTGESPFIEKILKGKDFEAITGILASHSQGHSHYHNFHESIFFILSGEAIEYIEGEEVPLKVNDVLYIPAKEKHMMVNRNDDDFRYLEIHIPAESEVLDSVEVK